MRHSVLCLALSPGFAGSVALAGPADAAFPGSNGRIVFVSDRDAPGPNGREIYTAAADGSDPVRLTTNSVADTESAYSPDGQKRAAAPPDSSCWVRRGRLVLRDRRRARNVKLKAGQAYLASAKR
jgi:hypothetical protein